MIMKSRAKKYLGGARPQNAELNPIAKTRPRKSIKGRFSSRKYENARKKVFGLK